MTNTPLDKDVAKSIVALTEAAGRGLSDLGEEIRKIEDRDMRETILRHVGNSMMDLYERVMRPILLVYPELDPDKGRDDSET